ncbi:MAG: hypothetical protein EA417_08700 [Gammaproteobacteria bacterium]|nr:MAG: hypothetical protein EA417_08700 [Gammaproteobacteria bacterium]
MNVKHTGKLFTLGAILAFGVGWGPLASATPAGTEILNDALLNFSVGGVAQDEISTADPDQDGTSRFLVDRRLDVLVTRADGTVVSVVPGAEGVVLSFDVTNQSNDTMDILLGLSRNEANDVFTIGSAAIDPPATVQGVCIDADTDGTCDTALVAEGSNGSIYRIPAVDADDTVRILVQFDIPSVAVNGEFDAWSLVAAVTDPGAGDVLAQVDSNGRVMLGSSVAAVDEADDPDVVQNVFADVAGDLGYDFVADTASSTADVANGGQHSATSQFLISAAVMTIAKSSRVVWDPINGFGFGFAAGAAPPFDGSATGNNPRRIPGAVIEYTVTVSNAEDAATATGVLVADGPPALTSAVVGGTLFGDDETALPNIYIRACSAAEFAVGSETVADDFEADLDDCAAEASGSVIFYVVID